MSTSIQTRLRSLARATAYLLLATIVVLVNVVAGAVLCLRTDRAREQLLAWGLRRLAPVFPGGIAVTSSEGDLLQGVVLHDVVIKDLDGRAAVRIEKLDVAYSLPALLLTRVQVDRIEMDGVTVVSQPLADGRDNLQTMAVLAHPLPAIPRASPVSVLLDDLIVRARFVRLGPGMHLSHVPRDRDLRAEVHAQIQLSRLMNASVNELRVDVSSPAHARVELQGSARIAERVELHGVALRVTGDATQLQRRVGNLHLAGPISLTANASGAIDDLVATLSLSTREPPIRLHADAHVRHEGVDLRELRVRAPFAHLEAHGHYRYDRTGELVLHAGASDLRALALLGAPPLEGSLNLDATVQRDAAHLRARMFGFARDLSAGGRRIGQATVELSTDDLTGRLVVRARDLLLGAVALRSARLEAHGDDRALQLKVAARGPEGLELDLAMLGAPRVDAGRVHGLDASVQSARVRAGGTPWVLEGATHVSADFDARAYVVGPLEWRNGTQKISIEGRLREGVIEQASAAIAHFDLSQLAAVISPGHVLPHSDVNVKLDAKGPLDLPDIGGHFTAEADGRGQHDLIHIEASGEGRLALGRLHAKAFATIGGQKASAKVDMPWPLRPHEPIDVSVDASVLLNAWFAGVLVPKIIQNQPIILYTLGAMFTAQGSISGTTSAPRINASARLARWGAADSHGNIAASLEYRARKLSFSSTLDFSELPAGGGTAAGIVNATAELPVDLAPAFSGEAGGLLERAAPLHASVALHHIDIARLPFEGFAIVPLVRHGKIDGSVDLAGTWMHPKATAHLDAQGLDVGGVTGIAVDGQGQLDGEAATADLRVAVGGNDALHVHATVGERGVEVSDWTQAPITAAIATSGFDLGRLVLFKELDGNVTGSMSLTGSWARPRWEAKARIDALHSGSTSFRRCELSARMMNEVMSGAFVAVQMDGGMLEASVEGPRAGELRGALEARGFHLDLRSELLPKLREIHALLDGRLALVGTAARPQLGGTLMFSGGDLRLASSAVSYHALEGELGFRGQTIVLRVLRGQTGNGGSFDGDVRLTIERLKPQILSGSLHLRSYPVAAESLSGVVDATLSLDGNRTPRGYSTKVTLAHARVDLVDDHGLRGLIPLTRLEDVRVGTARPQPLDLPTSRPRTEPTDTVEIVGPLRVHCDEIDAQATSRLSIDMSTDVPTAIGTLDLSEGTVRLYGHAYDLERGQLRFEGTNNPTIDLRMTRGVPNARIGFVLGGSAREPTTRFFSSPSAYDAIQVASFVTGQRRERGGVSKKGIDDKSAGPLSSLIAASFRQAEPGRPVVDLGHSLPGREKVETLEISLPTSTK